MALADWTYSGDPAASNKDAVRFLSGDTSTGSQKLTDSEIAWALSQESDDTYRAAALTLDALASKKSDEADMSVGDLSIKASQKADSYTKKAKSLRALSIGRGVSIFAGGISETRKAAVETDTDRVEPFFTRNDFNNPSEESGASTERT